jgi:Fe-S cluster assembly protein SufD
MSKILTLTPEKPHAVVSVTEDTQFVLRLTPHKADTKYIAELVFETEGISAEILGMFSLKKSQFLDLTTITNHKVPHTSCTTKIKGVLADKSKANYVGKIIIAKPAQQTSSFLEHAVLVNGEETTNNSQPILEIEADDVKASHGSTTGRVDASQVYYLMSRGLSQKESQKLIVEGFFDTLLNTVSDEGVREQIRAELL